MVRSITSGMRLVVSMVFTILVCVTSTAKADFTFGEPVNLGATVNSFFHDTSPNISADGLSLFFCSDRPGGYGLSDIWLTTRETMENDWGVPVNLGSAVNSATDEWYSEISADGLSLYLTDGLWAWETSPRPGGLGQTDIWMTTRESIDDDWSTPVNLGPPISSSAHDSGPSISTDGLSLCFCSNRSGGTGGSDLWIATRPTVSDAWGPPVNLGSTVNSSDDDVEPDLSSDGLALFFMSTRSGGIGNYDLWVTMRASTGDDWGPPENLGPTVNSSAMDVEPCIQADGSNLFFMSDRAGGLGTSDLRDIWQASIIPIVDFNGDDRVDGFEVGRMADLWGTDDSLCDIGPMPWGDGIVDVEDVKVLAKFIGEPVNDSTLIALWTLDETEGDIAHDSAAGNDATVIGDPAWEPDDGMVDGALMLDGVDDHITSESVINPADGPFSVLAWVKGGALGQVIVSQIDGVSWLMVDAVEGTLATELVPPAGRNPVPPLVSDSVVTDDLWHRVAFVWDGASRSLYVDETLVARDEQTSLVGSDGGLYIGCGADQSPGTFFSGLIDDVRIYNRAARP